MPFMREQSRQYLIDQQMLDGEIVERFMRDDRDLPLRGVQNEIAKLGKPKQKTVCLPGHAQGDGVVGFAPFVLPIASWRKAWCGKMYQDRKRNCRPGVERQFLEMEGALEELVAEKEGIQAISKTIGFLWPFIPVQRKQMGKSDHPHQVGHCHAFDDHARTAIGKITQLAIHFQAWAVVRQALVFFFRLSGCRYGFVTHV